MQSTAVDPGVPAADTSAHAAQADAQQQSRTQDISIQQQQQGSEVKTQYVEAHAALRKKQPSVLDEQQQPKMKPMGLQQPQSLQQVQLASKRQHSLSKRTKPPGSPVKREPAVGDEPAAASISTLMAQPHLVQTQQQVPHEPMQTQQKAEALQQQQQHVSALQQPLQQQYAEAQRQQQQHEVQQFQAPQLGTHLQQQQRIEPQQQQQQQQQHTGATLSFDSNRSAATVVRYTTSIGQDRAGAESADDPAASSPWAVLQPTGTASRATVQRPPAAGIPAATAVARDSHASTATAAAAAAGEMDIGSNPSPSQLMQMIVDQARKMRAEQACKAKELSRANKKLQKLQQQKAELQAELESQRAFEGIDIENVTVQQLQDMIGKVAEQRREVAEQLAAEERELEVQQQVLHDLQEQDREMDARLQRELMERLELLQQFVQDRMVE